LGSDPPRQAICQLVEADQEGSQRLADQSARNQTSRHGFQASQELRFGDRRETAGTIRR
jgi:hypothetical protein